MSGIRKTRENYIAGRYYSPVIKQFLSPVNPETVLADALTAYGLNLYSLCLTNPVNLAYNEYTIEPGVELTYTPPALSAWDLFWRRPIAKVLAVTIFCFATLLAILNPEFLPLYFETLAGIATSLLMGATIAGIQARENGDPFWQSFGNYLNENWAQTLAISMAVFIIICGISLIYHAFIRAGRKCYEPEPANIHGKAHGSAEHQARIMQEVEKMQASGQYTDIYLNKALNTVGLNGTQRPDIIGKMIDGKFDAIEVASKTQIQTSRAGILLSNKVAAIKVANPPLIFRDIIWLFG